METEEEHWRDWNWRSEGDIMVNGAYFVASGEGLEAKYEKAFSVEPKSVSFIDQLTMNAGVLGSRFAFLHFLSFSFFLFLSLFLFPFTFLFLFFFA